MNLLNVILLILFPSQQIILETRIFWCIRRWTSLFMFLMYVFVVNGPSFQITRIRNCSTLTNSRYCVKSVRIRSYSGAYFPAFGLWTERYSVSLRIQSQYGKIEPEKLWIRTLFKQCISWFYPLVFKLVPDFDFCIRKNLYKHNETEIAQKWKTSQEQMEEQRLKNRPTLLFGVFCKPV